MACARVCCILLGETRLLKWYVPVCAVFSQGSRDCSSGMCPCVLHSPRGDEIAQMVSASCVLYSPRGDEIAQMACARVCCILLGEIAQILCDLVCCILSRGDDIAQMACASCVLYSPRGEEIAQMVCAHVCCFILLGETRLLKWQVPMCAVFSQGRRDCSNGMCPCVLYSPRGDCSNGMLPLCAGILLDETSVLKWHYARSELYSPREVEIAQMVGARVCCILLLGRRDCSNGMCPCVLYSPRGDEIAQMACALVCCILLGETRLLKWHVPVCAVFS